MSNYRFFSASLLLLVSTSGETPPPYFMECKTLNDIPKVVRASGEKRWMALTVLEKIVLGEASKIDPNDASALGLNFSESGITNFLSSTARVCAVQALAEVNTPEAITFLEGLSLAQLEPDSTKRVWPAAQVALQGLRLREITSPPERTGYLVNILTTRHDNVANNALVSWATETLCDSGEASALPVVRASIRKWSAADRAEDEIRFCEARVRTITASSDRVKALGAVLNTRGSEDPQLLSWAIRQLVAIRSSAAVSELRRFSAELGVLAKESQSGARYEPIKSQVERGLRRLDADGTSGER